MPVKSITNQYRGVNAHLHSAWQHRSGWAGFHTFHIGSIAGALQAVLAPLGYQANIEESLQIRRADESPKRPRADIRIDDRHPLRRASMTSADASVLTGVVIPLIAAAVDPNPISDKPYSAVTISPADAEEQPIAWIELLSPTNKYPNSDAETYLQKRANLIDAGLVYVELDYLHESPPTLGILPDYSAKQMSDAYPYRVIVIDPRPNRQRGYVSINEFDVDVPIPSVAIPLSGKDVITFDFNAPYHESLRIMQFGLRKEANYAALPVHFDRYRADDQARIARRMLAVIEAARAGGDLETANIQLDESLTLETALERLQPHVEGLTT